MEQRIALTLNDGQIFSGRLQAAENFVPGSSTLEIIDGGDHSFDPPATAGPDARDQAYRRILERSVAWVSAHFPCP